MMTIPKIKEETTSRPTAVATTSTNETPTTTMPQHHRLSWHKVNVQSVVTSILLLFCLNLYLNIADFDRFRKESRSAVLVLQNVPSLQDGGGDPVHGVIKEEASISAQSITLSKSEFRVVPEEAALQLSMPAHGQRGHGGHARNNNNGNPTLVLHMGPTKTGSTFTQCVLTSMGETLALDNYTYLGMGITPCLPEEEEDSSSTTTQQQRKQQLIQHCYNSMFNYKGLAKLAPEAISIFRRARLQQKNAIFVNECFEFYTPDQIKVLAAELRPSWNVKIIMNYRRLYEFLPSSYNQNLKPKLHVPEFELWPGERAKIGAVVDDIGTRKMVEGRAIAPFDIENRNGFTNQFRKMENEGVHPIEEVRRLYRHFWPDITIIKLHELNRTVSGDAGLQKMFCDILDMPHSCEAAKLDSTIEVAAPYSNSFQALDYELLASEAFRLELFGFQEKGDGLTMKRRRAVRKIKHHQEKHLNLTINDFPQECLAKHKLDRIINASLFVERTLFPKECCTEEVVANHRRAFDDYNKKKKRYCTIDVIETLKNGDWLDFLASF